MHQQTFHVEGMACEHCKARLEQALKQLSGVVEAVADVAKKQVEVTFEPDQVSTQQLQDAAEDCGYGLVI
ncbi:MAG: heavy-metal-associated domain-containing protein [Bacteroidales bacterium]|nr:heavy-metal-associated domain-containing protein [Bacteroidales bacterium]